MFILRKMIRITVTTIQGVVMGIFLNISWHFFLAAVIGWGDSAPDWYFYRQETIFVCIFIIGLIGWIIFSLQIKKKPIAYITIPTKKELTKRFETIGDEALR
jgi:hypothetical protein